MSCIIRIIGENRITLPVGFMKELNLDRGNFLIGCVRNGVIELKPAKIVERKEDEKE